ncbi:hypothetical protein BGX33_002023, partial [Mortierella sp. NVP41]
EPKDQLFVTCNGITIDIYSAFETWTPLRSIVLDSAFTSPNYVRDIGYTLSNQLRGGHLITGDNTEIAFIFDIALGAQVSFTASLSSEQVWSMNYLSSMSKNGWFIAVPGLRHVSVYRARTWKLLGSYVFHEIASNERLLKVTFVCNDSFLYVEIESNESFQYQRHAGYLLITATMSVFDRVVPSGREPYVAQPMTKSIQGIAFLGYTKLRHMRLEDRIYQFTSRNASHCTNNCRNADSLQADVEEATSPVGLRLKAQTTDTSFGSHLKRDKTSSLAVTMTDNKVLGPRR